MLREGLEPSMSFRLPGKNRGLGHTAYGAIYFSMSRAGLEPATTCLNQFAVLRKRQGLYQLSYRLKTLDRLYFLISATIAQENSATLREQDGFFSRLDKFHPARSNTFVIHFLKNSNKKPLGLSPEGLYFITGSGLRPEPALYHRFKTYCYFVPLL